MFSADQKVCVDLVGADCSEGPPVPIPNTAVKLEGPPVPIPNTAVKLTCAENTWLATAWEDR